MYSKRLRTGRTLLPVVVTATRHLQDSTHLLNASLGEVLGDEAVACHYCLSEKMPTAFLDVPLPSHTLQLAAQTPDLFVPVTQMAGAGEGFFPPIPQLLFSTD